MGQKLNSHHLKKAGFSSSINSSSAGAPKTVCHHYHVIFGFLAVGNWFVSQQKKCHSSEW